MLKRNTKRNHLIQRFKRVFFNSRRGLWKWKWNRYVRGRVLREGRVPTNLFTRVYISLTLLHDIWSRYAYGYTYMYILYVVHSTIIIELEYCWVVLENRFNILSPKSSSVRNKLVLRWICVIFCVYLHYYLKVFG